MAATVRTRETNATRHPPMLAGSARPNAMAPTPSRIVIPIVASTRLIVSWAASSQDGETGVVESRRSTPCSR